MCPQRLKNEKNIRILKSRRMGSTFSMGEGDEKCIQVLGRESSVLVKLTRLYWLNGGHMANFRQQRN
jgi:hypothetical protein